MSDKIGVTIITYNSENYFETLFNSLPVYKDYELVVVNGGEPYSKTYKRINGEVHWIQHPENYGSAKSRNDGLKKLYELGCDHMFLLEDDVICRSENIFDEYISASKITGLEYFHFVSYAWGVGKPGARTPKLQVRYTPSLSINFYHHQCNEMSYRTRKLYEKVGEYDENMVNMFDSEWIKRASETPNVAPMWYFADLFISDSLIMNNPDSVSRLDADGKRVERLKPDMEYFIKKHGHHIAQTPKTEQDKVVEKLRKIHNSTERK